MRYTFAVVSLLRGKGASFGVVCLLCVHMIKVNFKAILKVSMAKLKELSYSNSLILHSNWSVSELFANILYRRLLCRHIALAKINMHY